LANAIIAGIVDDAIALWTDGTPSDEAYTRHNILTIGSNCVVLHDKVEAWLTQIASVLSDGSLATLPPDGLANELVSRLQALARSNQAELGVIVAGFQPNGTPILLGLHSGRDFSVRPFRPSVIGGVPPCIWNYIQSALRGIPGTVDNVVDKLLLAGNAYCDIISSRTGSPSASSVALFRNRQELSWLSREEVNERIGRNGQRVCALHQHLVGDLMEIGL